MLKLILNGGGCGVKSRIFFLILIILSNFDAQGQQDPQFSMNMFNQLSVNPAYAGQNDMLNAYLMHRTQWSGFEGAPVTFLAGADMGIRLIGETDGIGLTIMQDEIGYLKDVSVKFAYAYRKQIGRGNLSIGISLGFLNKTLKPDWEGEFDENDPSIPQSEVNGTSLDVGIGTYYSHPRYYAGFSINHLNQASYDYENDQQFSQKRHYYLTAGYNFQLSNPLYVITPSFYYKTDGVGSQVDINTLVKYKKRYSGGLSYRPGDAVVIIAGIELKNGIRFSYAYDIGTSAISNYNDGSHELYLSYSLGLRKGGARKHKSVRYL